MTAALPSTCVAALKEWATVLHAMARGEQLVLIRKGGLIEPGRGFELRAQTFVFYPTFEHQAVQYLAPPFRGYFEEAVRRRAPEGHLRVELVGTAVSSVTSKDPAILERLTAYHIYNQEFLTQRLKWNPTQPLAIVVIRAFALATPQILPMNPQYAGCTSWVDLDRPVSLEGARPVLDEETFQQRLRELSPLLASPSGAAP